MSSPRSRKPISTSPSSSRTSGTSAPLSASFAKRLHLDRLDADRNGGDHFRGEAGPTNHLFGGQLLAQGLLGAAACTAPELRAQSLHAVFLAAGDGTEPVDYRVESLRDGASFATRRITGSQGDRTIVALTASFHRPEGPVLHQAKQPTWAGSPENAPIGRYDSAQFESRDVPSVPSPADSAARADRSGGSDRSDQRPLAHWSRLRDAMPDDPSTVEAMVAWLSDNGPTRAGRRPNEGHPGFDRVRSTSLDHHLWFHQPADLNRWHLSTLRSEVTADARGLVRGTIHDETGRHIASLVQEVLIRLPGS